MGHIGDGVLIVLNNLNVIICFQSFSESENECPACLPNNAQIMDFIKAQEQGRDLHETFHSELGKAHDGFTLVANYFGRGVFNKLTIINELAHRTSTKSVNSFILSSQMLTKFVEEKQLVQSSAMRTPVTKPDAEQSVFIKPKGEYEQGMVKSNLAKLKSPPTQETSDDSLSQAVISPNVEAQKAACLNPFDDDDDDYPAEHNPFENDKESFS